MLVLQNHQHHHQASLHHRQTQAHQIENHGGNTPHHKGDHSNDKDKEPAKDPHEGQEPVYEEKTIIEYSEQVWAQLMSYQEYECQALAQAVNLKDTYTHTVKKSFDGDPLKLTFKLAGQVWIDKDEQKDQSTGTMGIYEDGEITAPEETVEVIVWKYIVDSETGETDRNECEKAIGWDLDGNEINFKENRLYVDENGRWEIPRIQFPSIPQNSEENYQVVGYDVEFIYDGQTYEPTEYMIEANGETIESRTDTYWENKDNDDTFYDNSCATENAEDREIFDLTFSEVAGESPIENNNTTGKTIVPRETNDLLYNEGIYYYDEDEEAIGADEAFLKYESEDYEGESEYTKLQTRLITNEGEYDEERGLYTGKVKPKHRFHACLMDSGWIVIFDRTFIMPEEQRIEIDELNLATADEEDATREYRGETYNLLTDWTRHINLGLLERYHADVSTAKDLYSSKIIVNNQESPVATYNSLQPLTEEALHVQVQPGYREQTYKIDLYNSDFNYRSNVYNTITDTLTKDVIYPIKDETELRLFVTYKITFRNESVELKAAINEFKDYYDSTFTPILEDTTARVELTDDESDKNGKAQYAEKVVAYAPYYRRLGTTSTAEYYWNKDEDLTKASGVLKADNLSFELDNNFGGDGYKCMTSQGLRAVNEGNIDDEELLLGPGEYFEVFVTYEVDTEGFNRIQANKSSESLDYAPHGERENLLGSKNNIVEISNYSTVYAKNRHTTTRYSVGNIAGRVDQDSAPDNINFGDGIDNTEDDTEFAPVLDVDVREPKDRTLNGVVWEDKKVDNEDGLADGDGIYNEENETGIPGIDVTLVEKIRVTGEDLKDANGEVKDLNMLDYEFEFIWPDDAFEGLDTTINSNENGAYSFNNFVSGDYVVRFEYGNKDDDTLKYNGQDYKMTAYQIDMRNADLDNEEDKGKIVLGTSDVKDRSRMYTVNNEWHDLSANSEADKLNNGSDRVSDARDYEPRRIKVMAYSRNITNKNAEVLASYVDSKDTNLTEEYKNILEANREDLITHTAMVANTAKFKVDVEKQDNITYKKDETKEDGDIGSVVKTVEGTKDKDYVIPNVDFGLIERPETRLYTKKEIAGIDLYKNDGTGLILAVKCDDDGNLIKTNGSADLEGSSHLNKISEIEKLNLQLGTQGFKYVAIESSFLAGMEINLTYKITVYNASDVDYIGKALSEIANGKELYEKAVAYENEAKDGLIPFNTGNDIVYGKYVGLHYYTNKLVNDNSNRDYDFDYADERFKDVVAATTIDQIVDYVDNDISLNLEETQRIENKSWTLSTLDDVKNKLSRVAYKENDENKDKDNLVDNNDRKYIGTDLRNNIALSDNELIEYTDRYEYIKTAVTDENGADVPVMKKDGNTLIPETMSIELRNVYSTNKGVSMYNPSLTKELRPGQSAEIAITTSAHANSEEADSMNYDNLAEILMYSNAVGRRDTEAIPGNANMIAKQVPAWKAGYNQLEGSVAGVTTEVLGASNSWNWVSDAEKTRYNENVPNFTTRDVSEYESIVGGQALTTERDAYAARDTVIFSEPTGLSSLRQNVDRTVKLILLSLISAVVIMATIVIMIKLRNKIYADKRLLSKE